MSEIIVYNGKRYIRCSRCGDDQWLHEDGCRNCQHVIDQGLCWRCLIRDSLPPEIPVETMSGERWSAIIATGPQVVSFGVDQGDERE